MKILQLVDAGLQLRAQIAALKEKLEKIEADLLAAALSEPMVPLVDEEREGMQVLVQGTEATIPIVFTADCLIGSFKGGGDTHKRIVAALPESMRLYPFYERSNTMEVVPKNGKAFRAVARDLLGPSAPAFITACLSRDKNGIPKSSIKIEWNRASAEQDVP